MCLAFLFVQDEPIPLEADLRAVQAVADALARPALGSACALQRSRLTRAAMDPAVACVTDSVLLSAAGCLHMLAPRCKSSGTAVTLKPVGACASDSAVSPPIHMPC